MNRRSFLRLLGLGTLGVAAGAPLLSLVTPKPKDLGISIRFHRDAFAMVNPCRMDVLYGYGTFRPDLACRVFA